jgi:uncharacterized protein with HEPN domain
MQPNNRDASALWDMAQAIREIQSFTASFDRANYLQTLWVQRVVERNLEILGEAARRVSEDLQDVHPEIDWRNTIGLRNIIIHRYDRVDQEILWDIVTNILPSLLLQIESLLPS